jgi:hypothetical protein
MIEMIDSEQVSFWELAVTTPQSMFLTLSFIH